MCRREDKAMITPSHLNTNSVLSVEYKISESHLGSISSFLTSASPQTWWYPRSSCPLSSSPWWPPPCPARDRSPGGYCWCGPRDISSWCHYHPSSVTILFPYALYTALPQSEVIFYSEFSLLTSQLQRVTPSGVMPNFLISDVKLSRSVITFRFLLFLRQNWRNMKGSFQIFQQEEKIGLPGTPYYRNKDSFESIQWFITWWKPIYTFP